MSILMVSCGPDAVPAATIARLANEAEAVVAVDGGGRRCLDAGVTPVLLIGDLDSLPAEDAENLRALGVDFSTHPVLKDRSDLDLALEEVEQRWGGEVLVTGALGGRLDHTLASLGVMAQRSGLTIDVIEETVEVSVLRADGRASVEVAEEDTLFSVFALTEAAVSIEGAFWPLERHRLEPLSSLGLSNRVEGPAARVTANEGVVFVVRPTTAGSACD